MPVGLNPRGPLRHPDFLWADTSELVKRETDFSPLASPNPGYAHTRLGDLVEYCFTSTKTVGLLGTGTQDGHLDFHTAPELRFTAELS